MLCFVRFGLISRSVSDINPQTFYHPRTHRKSERGAAIFERLKHTKISGFDF
jgi:hypothetical protein